MPDDTKPGKPLADRKVAILATDGVEQVELVEPTKALRAAGAEVQLISLKSGSIQAFNHLDKAATFPVDRTVEKVNADEYHALFIPGGVANPDALRADEKAVGFVRSFVELDKPVASICHGPWLLVEADAVKGRTLTSWPSLRTDITNAGGSWVDKTVQVDQKLVTSRKPDDLPVFCKKMVSVFADAAAETQVDTLVEQTFPASDAPPGPAAPGGSSRARRDAELRA